jgi:drug/metabolite transporter (DMT)-like permease
VILVLINGNLMGLNDRSIIGAIFCVLGAMSCGLFSTLTKKITYDKNISVMIYYLVSFIISSIYIVISKDWFIIEPAQIRGFVWTGIFTSGIAYTLWALALEKGDTAKISTLAYMSPFLSLIWTSVILKENISIYSVIGLIIIVLGIFIQLKDSNMDKNKAKMK